jgi:hypothetical protein
VAVTPGSIKVAEAAAGKLLDTTVVTTAEGSVHREATFAGDPEDPAARANVRNATPGGTDYGLVVRAIIAATQLGDVGALSDAEAAAGNGTVIAILKRLRTLLNAGLPSALTGSGNLKVAVQEALPAGTNDIGGVDVLSIGAGVERIGKVTIRDSNDLADINPLSESAFLNRTNDLGQKTMGASMPVVVASDQSALPMDLRRSQTLLFAAIDVAGSGDNTIVAANATKKIKVLSYSIVVDAAVTGRWKSGAATNLSGAMSFAANGGISEGGGNAPGAQWLFETAVNQALVLNLGGAVGARGRVTYFLEA